MSPAEIHTSKVQGYLHDMDKFEKKMKDAGLSEAAIAAFRMNYDQLAGGATGLVSLITITNSYQLYL